MNHLKKLCALEGVSGREEAVRAYVLEALAGSKAPKRVEVDALGSVIVRLQGKRPASRPVLFAAHMDEVGLIVTGATEEGFLRFATVGGLDPRVLFGRKVLVNGHAGLIGSKAVHMCSKEERKTVPSSDKLLIDVGTDSREAALKIARPGDVAAFDSGYIRLEGGLVKARALDDRAGCALLLKLAEEQPETDIMLAFTVQEEIGLRGAKTVAYAVRPELAVVIDSTTANDTAGVPDDKQVCRVGAGPVVSFMDNRTLYDRGLYEEIFRIAGEEHIQTQPKTAVAGGNDAGAIQLSRSGVRVAAVSLPCRYIHSPSCVLSKKDMEETLSLMRALAARLPV